MSHDVIFYGLATCDTCRKAKKYLKGRGVTLLERPIRETPPSRADLERWIDAGDLKAFLNTSSEDYRSRGLSKRTLSKAEVLDLIDATPNLIKRPVVVVGDRAVFGFKPEAYDALLS
jgi:arsenate reductase